MKRLLATGFIAAFAVLGSAGTASAARASPGCFGQVHKVINTQGALGFTNVGDVVKVVGGQGKNAIARSICAN